MNGHNPEHTCLLTSLAAMIPAGAVRILYADDVEDALAGIELDAGDGRQTAVVVALGRCPQTGHVIDAVVEHLATIAQRVWSSSMDLTDQPDVDPIWRTRAAAKVAVGGLPLPSEYSSSAHVRQLACVISNPHPFIILAIDAPVETLSSPHLDGVCRAAVWLCDAAHVGVALLMPTSFVGDSAIDSVDYQPLYWQPDTVEFKTSVSHRVTYSQPATKPPDSTERDPPSSQIHRVSENASEEDKLGPLPILGRPHPGSPGEMALAKAMEANAELAGRFGFNQPVRTTCGRRFIVDLLSSSDRVVVEVDGYRHHSSRRMFSADRDRDFRLHCDGYAVLRLPHHEVIQDVAAAIQIIVKFVGQAPTRVTTHTRK